MSFVLPQAPPKASVSHLKVPAASVPLKAAQDHAAPKTKFQALLDQLQQAVKPKAEPTEAPVKVPRAKVEAVSDRGKSTHEAKDAKKLDPKDPKAEGTEAALAALLPQPKIEAAKPKVPEAEPIQATLDKAKTSVRDRRTGAELAVPAPVTAAAAEIARTQAQQNAPRSERSEEKQKVFVVDRRTETKEKEKLKLPGAEAAAQQPVNAAVEVQAQPVKTDPKTAQAEVQVVFQSVSGKNKDGFDMKSQNSSVSPRDAATFQQYLVEKGYGQLVDQARIVLKDQNAGEIRMTLYPESLGKVKVALDLSDNTLAGQIFVENQTVKDVFQANLDGLMEAFRDGGWDQMSLEVSVGNGNGGQPGSRQDAAPVPARDYGRQVSTTAPAEVVTNRIGSWNDRQINLTA